MNKKTCDCCGAPKRKIQKEQLCWTCAKAYGGCSWSRSFEPVKGWTAVRSRNYSDGYRIKKYPEYMKG